MTRDTGCALVLLPGMDGTGELFAPLVRALGPDVQTIVVRYPNERLDYAGHERIARASLPTDRPFIVVGESFSGPIAISIAASAPAGMRGYVLCGSFVTCPTPAMKRLGPLAALFSPKVIPKVMVANMLMGSHSTHELRELLARSLSSVSASTLNARLKAIASVDVRAEAQGIRMPGMYLRATEDKVVKGWCANVFMAYVTHARLVEIAGPHLLSQTKPAEVARELLRACTEWCAEPVGTLVATT